MAHNCIDVKKKIKIESGKWKVESGKWKTGRKQPAHSVFSVFSVAKSLEKTSNKLVEFV